jgi:hypothetical protein
MTQPRRTSRKTGSSTRRKASTPGRTTAGRRRAPTPRSTAHRRRRPTLAATLGAGLGALVVAALVDASWPVRLALAVLALALAVGYARWSRRDQPPTTSSPTTPDSTTPDSTPTSEDQR